MLDLNDFFYFVHVVDRGGFTAASRALRLPKSTLSHRIRQLEAGLGVRLLNRTSRRFGITDAGGEFYRHAAEMLQQAEQAEASIRHRLSEPIGTVRFTSGMATMQFALREVVADFLVRHPKVNVVAHATDQNVDIVGENYDIAVRAHSDLLPSSTLVQRTLAPAPWLLFGGAAYLDANGSPTTPEDLRKHSSLFMMRTGVSPTWRLRQARLGRDHLDLYLLHWPNGVTDLSGVVTPFEKLRSAAKIRAWGVSNFKISDMEHLFHIPHGTATVAARERVRYGATFTTTHRKRLRYGYGHG
jgi:DNA-binding transcriptional LysR family regulator